MSRAWRRRHCSTRFNGRTLPLACAFSASALTRTNTPTGHFFRNTGSPLKPPSIPPERFLPRYGTFQIPETYIIDKSGVVAAKIISNRNWMDAEMINLIEMLL